MCHRILLPAAKTVDWGLRILSPLKSSPALVFCACYLWSISSSPAAMGSMGDGDRFRMELEVSSLWPARRRLWTDGRWRLGLGVADFPGSFQSDWAALFRIRTAHLTRGGTWKSWSKHCPLHFPPDVTPRSSGISKMRSTSQNYQAPLPFCDLERTNTNWFGLLRQTCPPLSYTDTT